ncbi:MAG: beta-lactamase family protein [Candidatus Eremiobacteraeota bacterium]|nr:beta-lactamase family protein [Candidatus Eremiobacteraeota bacterium]
MHAGSTAAAEAPNAPSDTTVVAGLRSMLTEMSAADTFSGAALLAKRDDLLFEGAYGYADHSMFVKNTIDTKFNIGSMGKMFTGVAILQLAQAGKLSLNDHLIKDLPNYPNRQIASAITIRQLLTHTSGLSDFFGPQFVASNMSRWNSLESLLPLFVKAPLLFAPGTKWQYSNAGFIVLGLVIAHLSGETYYDYVQRHIFDVAGMRDTGNWAADEDIPNRAVGYTTMGVDNGQRKSNIFFLQRGGSAGGGYSTVRDLLRFAQALEGQKLLNSYYTKLDLTGQVATGRPGVKYGFGMEERVVNGVRIVGHSGGGPGIQDIVDMYPDSGYVVCILTNLDYAMSRVDDYLRMALTGERAPQTIALSFDAGTAVVGKYAPVLPPNVGMKPPPIIVTIEGNGVRVDPGIGPAFHFVPVSVTEFVDAEDSSHHITFLKDANRHVTSLKTTGFGPVPPITATKQP